MKKFLALIAIATFLAGCTPTETTPVVGDDLIADTDLMVEDVVNEEDSTITENEDETVIEEEPLELSLYDVIINDEDITLEKCENLKNEKLRNKCNAVYYTNKAKEELDSSYCEEIEAGFEKDQCLLLSSTDGREAQQSGILD